MSLEAPTPLRRASRAQLPPDRRLSAEAAVARADADEPAVRATRARAAWRRLGLRIASVTPSQLAAGLLVVGGLAGLVWLVTSAWSSLLPLQIGLVLAYATLPLVNWLDRWMPRSMAALLVVLAELGALGLALLLLIPPFIDEVAHLVIAAPEAIQAPERVAQVNQLVATLPEPSRVFVNDALDQAALKVRDNADLYLQRLIGLVGAGLLTLFGTIGFVFSLLAVPTWLVSVLTDQRVGARTVNRLLPGWLRPDFWAVVRIVDRPFNRYLRGQLVVGLAVAAAVFLGLTGLDMLGLVSTRYRLGLATIAGVTQLIPSVGPILGVIPGLLVGLADSPEAAAAILALYIGVQVLVGQLVVPHVERRSIDIHPVLMVVLMAAVSQFGLLWVVVAPPLAVVVRDLFRYTLGRLADPPQPAGRLPGEAPPRPELLAVRAHRRA